MRRFGPAILIGWCLLVSIGLTLSPRAAHAQAVVLADRGPRFLRSARPGDAPVAIDASAAPTLRRVVSLTLDRPTVGALLAAIERQTGLEFVYSRAVLDVDRSVTLHADSITLATALTGILQDAGVDVLLTSGRRVVLVHRASSAVGAIVGKVSDGKTGSVLAGATVVVDGTSRSATTGSDGRYRIAGVAPGTYTVRARYIGYAPGTTPVTVTAGQEATADFALQKSAQRLDEVVTTGTVVPTEVKALPSPVSVITSDHLELRGYQRIDQIFRGDIPGAIAVDVGARNDFSSVLIRGSSAISGASSPKTFIDGVEISQPLSLAILDPNTVERIEVTRGPQASTLYGSGALDGVIQIFTKHGQLGLTRPEVSATAAAGTIEGFDGSSAALQTQSSAAILGGGDKTSYSVEGSFLHTGEWVPGYRARDWHVAVGTQTIQGPFTLSASARYSDKENEQPWDTRYAAYQCCSQPYFTTHRTRLQTYGLTAGFQATPTWQHTLVVGYDQNYFLHDQYQPRFTTPGDSTLGIFGGHEAKTSLLYHTDLTTRFGNTVASTLTAGVNHVAYDDVFYSTFGNTKDVGVLGGSTLAIRRPWTNTGYFGQVQLNVAERLFLTGGVRAEQNGNFGADYGTAWSPRVGAAYTVGVGPATVKLRGSYGESIRAPQSGARDAQHFPGTDILANPSLAPERQRGVDGGIDLFMGRFSAGVTYYRQTAVDLIDLTSVPSADSVPTYQNQNISRVLNRGLEFEVRAELDRVFMSGTLTTMTSVVDRLAPDYSGDLRVGDQLLGVPHTSAGVTLSYTPFKGTSITGTATYIGHLTNTDWIAEYGFFYGGQPFRGSFRDYWMEYPAVTKFGLGLRQVVSRGLTAFARVENLTNSLRSEGDNYNFPTPRSVMVGATVRY